MWIGNLLWTLTGEENTIIGKSTCAKCMHGIHILTVKKMLLTIMYMNKEE